MIRFIRLLPFLLLIPLPAFGQEEHLAVAKTGMGDWSDPGTWESGIVPNESGDSLWTVRIPESADLSLGTPVSIHKLELEGSLTINAEMTVTGEALVDAGRLRGSGSVEFAGQLTVSGDTGHWECDVLVSGSARFSHAAIIFVTSRISAGNSGRFEIAPEAVMEIEGSLTSADRPIGTEVGGGFVNHGRIRFINTGESFLQLGENRGIVDIGSHVVQLAGGDENLSGTFTSSASGKLIASSTRFTDANIDLSGELEVRGKTQITGGRMRAELLNIIPDGFLKMSSIFDTLVSEVLGGGIELETSALYVSNSIGLEAGRISLKNARLDVTNRFDARDSQLTGSGIINASLDMQDSVLALNEGMNLTLNGDLRLSRSPDSSTRSVMAIYFNGINTDEPILDVSGSVFLGGSIQLLRGNWVDIPNAKPVELVSADVLEVAEGFPEIGEYTAVDRDLLARFWHGEDSPYTDNILTANDFRVFNSWLVSGFPDIMNLPPEYLLPGSDPDEDGFSNQEEFIFGSWPMDPYDVPLLELALRHQTLGNVQDNQFVWFRAFPNSANYDVRYGLQISHDLKDWTSVSYIQFEDSVTQERDILLGTYYQQFRFSVDTDKPFFVRLEYELTGPATYPQLPVE